MSAKAAFAITVIAAPFLLLTAWLYAVGAFQDKFMRRTAIAVFVVVILTALTITII